jgi:hypothetical protein
MAAAAEELFATLVRADDDEQLRFILMVLESLDETDAAEIRLSAAKLRESGVSATDRDGFYRLFQTSPKPDKPAPPAPAPEDLSAEDFLGWDFWDTNSEPGPGVRPLPPACVCVRSPCTC